jgi:nitroreductase
VSWLDSADFLDVLEVVTRAPSMHNSQPWRFRLRDGGIDLLVDPGRLPVADASGWAARIACGAALYNLRLALAVRGTPAVVGLMPEHADANLLARLTPDTPRRPLPVEVGLYRAIPRRHSNRGPFADRPVPADVRAALLAAARAEDAWLDLLLGPAAVAAAAGLVQAAHDLLGRDPAYQAELSGWVRRDAAATDGVPVTAGGPAPRPFDLLPRRDFGGAQLPAHRDFEREPLVAVLGSAGDWPADQVTAGQALQRVLLTATDRGLAASLFSQPIEVGSVREQLRLALSRPVTPQMLVRFGYAPSAPPTPRRPVAEVVVD